MTEEKSQDPNDIPEEERFAELLAMLALAEGWVDTKPAGGTMEGLQDAATEASIETLNDENADENEENEVMKAFFISIIGEAAGACFTLGYFVGSGVVGAGIVGGLICIAFSGIFIGAGILVGSLAVSIYLYGFDEGISKWGKFWGGLFGI